MAEGADVTERRGLAAAPEAVWRALTTADGLRGWFWPERLALSAETDPRDGGRYRIASEVAGMAVSGRYTAFEPVSRLGFTWQWDGEDRESAVDVELAASDGGTELVLTHTGLADDEVASHVQGWSDCLDRLPEWLATN